MDSEWPSTARPARRRQQKTVWVEHCPRAGRGGAGLLEFTDKPIHIDRAAVVEPAYADVRIDHHHGLDMSRQTLEQAAQRRRLAAVDAVGETPPPGRAA